MPCIGAYFSSSRGIYILILEGILACLECTITTSFGSTDCYHLWRICLAGAIRCIADWKFIAL